jgi:hypothetical protein
LQTLEPLEGQKLTPTLFSLLKKKKKKKKKPTPSQHGFDSGTTLFTLLKKKKTNEKKSK